MVNRYRSSDQFITSIDFDSIANAGGKVQLVAARARTSRIKFSSTSRSTSPISFTAADCEADPNNRIGYRSLQPSDKTEDETRSADDEREHQVVERLRDSICKDALFVALAEALRVESREGVNEAGHASDDGEEQHGT